jgi:hypothetical protein
MRVAVNRTAAGLVIKTQEIRVTNTTIINIMRRREVLKLPLIFGVDINKAHITLIRRQEQIVDNSRTVSAMLKGMLMKTKPHKWLSRIKYRHGGAPR